VQPATPGSDGTLAEDHPISVPNPVDDAAPDGATVLASAGQSATTEPRTDVLPHEPNARWSNRTYVLVGLVTAAATSIAVACLTSKTARKIAFNILAQCTGLADEDDHEMWSDLFDDDFDDAPDFAVRCMDAELSHTQLKTALQTSLCVFLARYGWDATKKLLRGTVPLYLGLDVDTAGAPAAHDVTRSLFPDGWSRLPLAPRQGRLPRVGFWRQRAAARPGG
jgi:hypothetical protein